MATAGSRPDLVELFGLIDAIADTIAVDLAPAVLPQLTIARTRDRVRARLRRDKGFPLVGPNIEVASVPRPLEEAIAPLSFPQVAKGTGDSTIIVETPTDVSAQDREARHALLRRSIARYLRSHQYRDFEPYVSELPNQLSAA